MSAAVEPIIAASKRRREYLSSIDNVFLKIEKPSHLMTIAGAWFFDSELTADEVKTGLSVMVDKFPRLRQRVVHDPSSPSQMPHWENDPEYSIDNIVEVTRLEQHDDQHLARVLGEKLSLPYDPARPLWKSHLITGLANGGCVLLNRLHHAITDGQGSIRLILSSTKSQEELGTAQYQAGRDQHAAKKPRYANKCVALTYQLLSFPLVLLVLLWSLLKMLAHQIYLFFYNKKCLTHPLSTEKTVAWTRDIDLDEVKYVKNNLNCTVNDVLIASMTGAFREYLLSQQPEGQKQLPEKDLLCVIPVSMRKADDWSLGNKAVTLWLWLPVSIADPIKRLKEVKRRMDALKSSPEPVVSYNFVKFFAAIPRLLPVWLIRRYMNKAHAVMSNVPGPTGAITFAGKTISSYLPFLPQPGSGGVGLGILSYNNRVRCSVLVDEGAFKPDPFALMRAFEADFGVYQKLASEAEQQLQQQQQRQEAKKEQ